MLTLYIFGVLVALMFLGVPVAISMGMTSVLFFHGAGRGPEPDDGGPADVLVHHRLHAAGDPLLHHGRQPDEHRRRDHQDLPLRLGDVRPLLGRSGPGGHRRGGDHVRHDRRGGGRGGRSGDAVAESHAGTRLRPDLYRRHHRGGRDHRTGHPAEHPFRHLRHADRRLDRPAVHGRLCARLHDGLCHGCRRIFHLQTPQLSPPGTGLAAGNACQLQGGDPAPDGAGHHHRRDRERPVHSRPKPRSSAVSMP